MGVRATTEAWDWIAAGHAGSAAQKIILLRLADHVSDERKDAWPSTRHLEKMTQLSRNTVRKALEELEKKGAILRTRRKSSSGDDASTMYTWLLSEWEQKKSPLETTIKGGGAKTDPPRSIPDMGGVGQNMTHLGQSLEGGGSILGGGVGQSLGGGGSILDPEPTLNHNITTTTTPSFGRRCDSANAQKGNPDADLHITWPASVPDNLKESLAQLFQGMTEQLINDVLSVLDDRLTRAGSGSADSIHNIVAFTSRLVDKAKLGFLTLPTELTNARDDNRLSKQISALKKDWEAGGTLMINGIPFTVDPWPFVVTSHGSTNIGSIIKEGYEIHVENSKKIAAG